MRVVLAFLIHSALAVWAYVSKNVPSAADDEERRTRVKSLVLIAGVLCVSTTCFGQAVPSQIASVQLGNKFRLNTTSASRE
jgi:hypothetical protein